MDKKTLQKEIDTLSKATKLIFKKHGHIVPVVFFGTIFNNGQKALGEIPLIPPIMEKRFEALRFFGTKMKEDPKIKEIEYVLMMSEVFIGSPTDKEKAPLKPSEDPNAKDGIMITAMNQEGVQLAKTFEITKAKWWKKKGLKEVHKTTKIETSLLAEFWKGYKEPVITS